MHLVNVRARFGHHGGNGGQRSRNVAGAHADACQPACAHHAALNDGSQQQRVNVAAAQHQAHFLAFESLWVPDQRSQARRACALHQRFLHFKQHDDGLLNIAFIHQQQIIHQPADDFQRDLARRSHRYAFGNAVAALRVGRALDGVEHGREACGLNAHDLNVEFDRLGGCRHAGNQPAAANRHNQGVQVRHLVQHFQRHRALACHHVGVVIRMHEGQLLLLGQVQGVGAGFVERIAMKHNFCAKSARALHLHAGREARHDNHRPQTEPLCMVGHALRVVTRTHGDDAIARRGQLRQLVAGTALLE